MNDISRMTPEQLMLFADRELSQGRSLLRQLQVALEAGLDALPKKPLAQLTTEQRIAGLKMASASARLQMLFPNLRTSKNDTGV